MVLWGCCQKVRQAGCAHVFQLLGFDSSQSNTHSLVWPSFSLSVLPRSYYGSFDLVIVDILTEVADSLKVNQELTMLDAAMLLMKPEGIIIKNEDQGFVPGSTNHRTNYAVDLVFHDVPHYCLQVSTKPPKTTKPPK